MLKAALIVAGLWFLLIIVNFLVDYWKMFMNRKCPHCGSKMKYLSTKYDKDNNPIEYTFYCEECGHVEIVSNQRLINETY